MTQAAYRQLSSRVSYEKRAMTPLQIKAAHRINAALLRQDKEKMRDFKQHARTKED